MNETQNLPSDNLAKPTRRLPWIIGGLATLAIITAAALAGPAIAANLTPTPTASPTTTEYHATLTPAEEDTVQQQADQQAAQIAAEQKAAADAAAAQAAADAAAKAAPHSSSVAAGAPGSHVPFIASNDPNNANGGDYQDPATYCQSGSASTVNGVVVCD